ncbi:hypothetical protein [Bartonella sp. DGB2]|uniref:hypothetical protein n=1 Tax=Bartonella sp. DGB2 TaxID=3388426 RepID=UPI00398F95DD
MTDLSPKYRLLKDESIIVNGRTLYRIQALRDFGDSLTRWSGAKRHLRRLRIF